MKTTLKVIIVMILFMTTGFTYDITRAGVTKSVVDVRLVDMGGHEYIIATSYVPIQASTVTAKNNGTIYKETVNSTSSVAIQYTSSAIQIIHHVGCRSCCSTNNISIK